MEALRRILLPAAGLLICVGTARASPTDGTYSGTFDGSEIEVVVSGGVVTSWSISSYSPSGSGCPSNLSTSVTTCCTVGESFSCGSPALCDSATICAPNAVSYFLVTGTFSGNSVSGSFDFRFQGPVITIPPPCCVDTANSWSASKPGPTCSPAAAIACGDVAAGSTSAGGSTDEISEYGCGPTGLAGSEFAHTFSPGETFDVRVTLADSAGAADLDLFVLEDAGGGCDPGSCVGASATAEASERVDFTTDPAGTYYFVVDSDAGTGAYELSVDCALFRDGFESGNLDRWNTPP
jgi:hypothetical protein